ncbi:2-(1,2-epoxy-1,2-dihydrophenyl)acetyl-CoA isomerase [Marinobacter sp. DSM 26671]|uniref:enoyl-CoA hydratase/isomerase family protein n=1 Tax=Marinobacter sp. DSM 26671 TaxID=1761793 RepID=UPI0008E0DA08|nr:enoyl-CoA hydratase-related protein [Marinobacter sp. DSM 26671]SFE31437.1 2-(1,2-epoxy-1,2-dihydrophenyl)acetyl-CoA isomerase [Marinobacter sp. DSM 26671]
MTSPVILQFDDNNGVATLTFNRPEALNAINVPMAEAFLEATRSLRDRQGLRCVVLTGAGRAFMAGGDVASMAGSHVQAREAVNALLDALNPAILILRELNAPVIAGVRGFAAGAGLSLAMGADLIISDANARFMVAYDGIGTVPDCGGTWFLNRRIGAGRASQLMLLGQTLTAQEALAWGLINQVAVKGEFDETLDELTRKVAAGPSRAYAAFRRLSDEAFGADLSGHLEAERHAFLEAVGTSDFQEGVAAFLAKRPAQFRGQ